MDLCDALAIGSGDVVALVGGGGKTSALYRLGAELAARDMPVLLCGTTRFTPPASGHAPNLVIAPDFQTLDLTLRASPRWPLTAATGWGNKGRLLPLEPAWIDALHALHPDLIVVIEADGSAMRPFKAPGAHEPVIPGSATLVVTVAGMDAVDRPLDEIHVHRPERVAAIAGVTLGDPVTPVLVAATLVHPDGGRKGVPDAARWVVLLNKADNPKRRAVAETIAARVLPPAERVVIARLRYESPVVAVVRRDARTAGAGVDSLQRGKGGRACSAHTACLT